MGEQKEKLLTETQAAELCGVSLSFLQRRRTKGTKLSGPPWIKLGFLVRYRESDLMKWIEGNLKN